MPFCYEKSYSLSITDVFFLFSKVLVGLACDLELDKGVGSGEAHKWAWFRRYCTASRVLKALIERTVLPQGFCADVSCHLSLHVVKFCLLLVSLLRFTS